MPLPVSADWLLLMKCNQSGRAVGGTMSETRECVIVSVLCMNALKERRSLNGLLSLVN